MLSWEQYIYILLPNSSGHKIYINCSLMEFSNFADLYYYGSICMAEPLAFMEQNHYSLDYHPVKHI